MGIVGKVLAFPAYFTVALDLDFRYKSSPAMALGFVHIFGQKEALIPTFMAVLKLFGLTSKHYLVCPAKLLCLYVYVDEIMSETRLE